MCIRDRLYAGARNLRDYERSDGETHYLQSGVINTSEQLRDTRRRQYDLNLTGEYKIAEGHTVGASIDLYRYGGKPRTTITCLLYTSRNLNPIPQKLRASKLRAHTA